jgi:HEAT repeat protein
VGTKPKGTGIYNERWEKLNQLLEDRRKFEALMALLDRIDENEDTRAWLAWAKNEVRKTDPLANLASYLQLSEWTEKEALEIGADLWPEAEPE